MRLWALAVVAALVACGGSSKGGSPSIGPDGGNAVDAGPIDVADSGPIDVPDAGFPPPDAGTPDAGPTAPDGGTAALDCPASFESIPASSAPPPTAADPHSGAVLHPVWEVRPPPNFLMFFDGLMDQRGNLFWLEVSEQNDNDVVLASADKTGTVRFRAQTALSGFSSLYLVGDALVAIDNPQDFSTSPPTSTLTVSGFSTATGQLVWTIDPKAWADLGAGPPGSQGVSSSFKPAIVDNTIVIVTGSLLVAIDAVSGQISWTSAVLPDGFVSVFASPAGTVFESSQGADSSDSSDRQTQLAKGPVTAPPVTFFNGLLPFLDAAPGPVLMSNGDTLFSFVQFFCQKDARPLGEKIDRATSVATTADAAWLRQNEDLLLYDVDTGKLKSRFNANPRIGDFRPAVASSAALLWINQSITFPGGTSDSRVQGPPTLHILEADGREVMNRALPMETEAYDGLDNKFGASFGDRVFLGGELLPAAGAFGVIRAFDIPGWASGQVVP
jgi:hypothetical protein